jgi:23S rRNA (cytosine1962-C5)-methyltransferase
MRIAEGWSEYELIDASDGQRLERWGGVTLQRPDPQVIWKTERSRAGWQGADAVYHRSPKGGGSWEYRRDIPDEWIIKWDGGMRLCVAPTGFKHTGVFPEQAANWRLYGRLIADCGRPVKVINLFGYTGAATVACAMAGASVCHVDASRGMVSAARRNARLNGLEAAPIRYIVDDCAKFVARELRRGSRYDAVIMDPPSYGRGPSGEIWRMENDIYDFLLLCRGLLSEKPLFFALNSYTAGLSPSVSRYVLASALAGLEGTVEADELGLMVSSSGLAMPCGSTAVFIAAGCGEH